MEAGIDDVGCGVLFGLENYKYDFVGMLMHAHHLERTYGCGPHTISVPRIRPADDIVILIPLTTEFLTTCSRG